MKLARLSLSAVFLGGIACSSVQTVRNPSQFFATNPELVVVVYNDNSEVPIAQPQMRGDTIVGTWHGLGEAVEVPMGEVQSISAVMKDSRKTTLFVVALVGIGAATAWGLSQAVNNDGTLCDYNRAGTGNGDINDTGPCHRIR